MDISGNMSGESLRKIFIAALSKVDDIKQVSFTSTIQNVVSCAMALNSTPVKSVNIAWGEPIPADYSELVNTENSRVAAGTQSKLTTIMTLDNVSEEDAMAEMERMELERAKILNQTQIKWMMLRITQLFNINFCSQTANMITF